MRRAECQWPSLPNSKRVIGRHTSVVEIHCNREKFCLNLSMLSSLARSEPLKNYSIFCFPRLATAARNWWTTACCNPSPHCLNLGELFAIFGLRRNLLTFDFLAFDFWTSHFLIFSAEKCSYWCFPCHALDLAYLLLFLIVFHCSELTANCCRQFCALARPRAASPSSLVFYP